MTESQWRTHRLELDDQTLREWDAVVLAPASPTASSLDRSAFYPAAAASRRTRAFCCGAGCRPGSSGAGKATTCT